MTTSTQKVSDLRIVLLGKTGSGKSATGNTILGKKAFKDVDFMKSASKLCAKREGVVGGKTISVFDTPGLFNTAVTKHQLKAEIQKCIRMSFSGPHVFLLVLKLGVRFTKEERDTVKWIQENFGDEALCRTIILFTHADQLKGKPLEEYIKESDHLQKIVDSCGGRYHSFNNKDRNNQDQVTELLKNINAIMQTNEMNPYTVDMFKRTQIEMTRKETKIKSTIIVLAVVMLVFGIWYFGILPPQLQEMSPLQKRRPSQLQEKMPVHLLENNCMCSCSASYWIYSKYCYRYKSNSSYRKCKAGTEEDGITAAKEVTAAKEGITAAKEVTAAKGITAAKEVTAAKEGITAAKEDGITAAKEVTAAKEDGITAAKEVTAAKEDGITAAKEVTAAKEDGITAAKEVTAAKEDGITAAKEDGITAAKEDGITQLQKRMASQLQKKSQLQEKCYYSYST